MYSISDVIEELKRICSSATTENRIKVNLKFIVEERDKIVNIYPANTFHSE